MLDPPNYSSLFRNNSSIVVVDDGGVFVFVLFDTEFSQHEQVSLLQLAVIFNCFAVLWYLLGLCSLSGLSR